MLAQGQSSSEKKGKVEKNCILFNISKMHNLKWQSLIYSKCESTIKNINYDHLKNLIGKAFLK